MHSPGPDAPRPNIDSVGWLVLARGRVCILCMMLQRQCMAWNPIFGAPRGLQGSSQFSASAARRPAAARRGGRPGTARWLCRSPMILPMILPMQCHARMSGMMPSAALAGFRPRASGAARRCAAGAIHGTARWCSRATNGDAKAASGPSARQIAPCPVAGSLAVCARATAACTDRRTSAGYSPAEGWCARNQS